MNQGEPTGHEVVAVTSQRAESDAKPIELCLYDRGPRTRCAYRADVAAFLARIGKPLRAVTLNDVQAFEDSLAHLATASQARKPSAVKSLTRPRHVAIRRSSPSPISGDASRTEEATG